MTATNVTIWASRRLAVLTVAVAAAFGATACTSADSLSESDTNALDAVGKSRPNDGDDANHGRGAPGFPGGGGSGQSSSGSGESNGGGSANGAGEAAGFPGGGGNGSVAAGAPIKIPSIVQDQGRPLAVVKAEIEESVIEQCGGSLCIRLTVEELDAGFQTCQFVRTDPEQGSEVDRDTSVIIVAGTLPCESGQTTEEEATTPDGEGSSRTDGTTGEQEGAPDERDTRSQDPENSESTDGGQGEEIDERDSP